MITNDSSEEEYSYVVAISAGHGITPLEYIYYESPMLVDTDHKPFTAIFRQLGVALCATFRNSSQSSRYMSLLWHILHRCICKMLNCCMHLSNRKKKKKGNISTQGTNVYSAGKSYSIVFMWKPKQG